MRKNVGSTLYLLAKFHSAMYETVRLRIQEDGLDMKSKEGPARQLDKARNKLFAKSQLLIQSLRSQATFTKWDIAIGGQFPIYQYQKLIHHLSSMLSFISLVSLASSTFSDIQDEREKRLEWLDSFRKVARSADVVSQQVTTLLCLLSASITNENPLPPYLKIPEPWALSDRMDDVDKDILSLRHIAEPGYATFAVIQIGIRCMMDDLEQIMNGVKELVGELDFSYRLTSAEDAPAPSRRPFEHETT